MPRKAEVHKPKVLAGIPCYNEAAFIADMIPRIQRYVDQVVVVDDGSTDETSQLAEESGATVVRHDTNKGYGEAIRSCFQAAQENGADVLVTLDGDGQHDPEELPEVLEPVVSGEADLVIGSRFLGKHTNVPRYRKFGIDVITFLYNIGSQVKVSDAQSGFRAYGREALDGLSLKDRGMGISVEVLVKARRQGYRIKEVPITCTYHDAGSSLNPVRHGVGVALTVVKHRLQSTWIKPASAARVRKK